MQLCNKDEFCTSQLNISHAIWQTLHALTEPHIFHKFVKFPQTRHKAQSLSFLTLESLMESSVLVR